MRQSVLFVAVIRSVVVLANVACLAVERLAASFKPEMHRYRYAYAMAVVTTRRARCSSGGAWRFTRHDSPSDGCSFGSGLPSPHPMTDCRHRFG